MTHEFEFHDASIESVAQNGETLELKLMASLIVSDDEGRWLDEEDHFVPITLRLTVRPGAELPRAETVISDGELLDVADLDDAGIIPADFSHAGDCGLSLTTDDGTFVIRGQNLKISTDLTQLPTHLK